jgi:O-antigen/teichoic acid export membrane protein
MKQALHPIAFQQEAQPEKQKYFLRRSATVYYGVALLFGLVLALFSREMVMLLARKESYHAVWVIVPLIIFGYVQHGLGNFLGVGMVMAKKATYQSGILVVTALINIGLNFILIPYIDIWGAAIATVAAYIVWNYLKALYSWKFYGLSFEAKRLYLLSFLWVVFVLAGLLILFPSLYLTILFRLVLIALFPVIVFFSGFLNTDEKEFVLQLFKKTLQRRTCKTRT